MIMRMQALALGPFCRERLLPPMYNPLQMTATPRMLVTLRRAESRIAQCMHPRGVWRRRTAQLSPRHGSSLQYGPETPRINAASAEAVRMPIAKPPTIT